MRLLYFTTSLISVGLHRRLWDFTDFRNEFKDIQVDFVDALLDVIGVSDFHWLAKDVIHFPMDVIFSDLHFVLRRSSCNS